MIAFGSLTVFAVMILAAALWLYSLVDALRTDRRTWSAAGHQQLVWVLVIIVLPLLGSVLYLMIAGPALNRSRAN